MNQFIVTANPMGVRESLHLWSLGDSAEQFVSQEIDFENAGELRDVASIICNEQNLDRVIDTVTASFPGRDVFTYQLISVASRKVGEIVKKEVSKDGILPF